MQTQNETAEGTAANNYLELVAALEKEDKGSIAAAGKLATIGGQDATNALLEKFKATGNSELRMAIIKCLRSEPISGELAIAPLHEFAEKQVIREKNAAEASEAIITLGEIGHRVFGDNIARRLAPRILHPWLNGSAVHKENMDMVIASLKTAMMRIGENAIEPMMGALKKADGDNANCGIIHDILADMNTPKARDALISCFQLHDGYWKKHRAYQRLVEMKGDVEDLLWEAFEKSFDDYFRRDALDLLCEINTDKSWAHVISHFEIVTLDALNRHYVKKIPDDYQIDQVGKVIESIFMTRMKYGKEERLAEVIKSDDALMALAYAKKITRNVLRVEFLGKTMGQIRDKRPKDLLEALKRTNDPLRQLHLVEWLTGTRDDEAIQTIFDLFKKHEYPLLGLECIRALCNAEGHGEIEDAIIKAVSDPSPRIRIAAADWFLERKGELAERGATAIYDALCKERDHLVSHTMIQVLARIGCKDSFDAMYLAFLLADQKMPLCGPLVANAKLLGIEPEQLVRRIHLDVTEERIGYHIGKYLVEMILLKNTLQTDDGCVRNAGKPDEIMSLVSHIRPLVSITPRTIAPIKT